MMVSRNKLTGFACVVLLIIAQTGVVNPQGDGEPSLSCATADADILKFVFGGVTFVAGQLDLDCTLSYVPNGWHWNAEVEIEAPNGTIVMAGVIDPITTTQWVYLVVAMAPIQTGLWTLTYKANTTDKAGQERHILAHGVTSSTF